MTFGVQTFTIRKTQKKDMEKSYAQLAKMGVSELEIARIDFTRENAEKVKAIDEKYGIHPVSIQVKPKYVFCQSDKVIEFCRITGCKNVVISMLPFRCILGGEDEFYDFIHKLDDAFDLYEKEGITLAYHHHNWEYVRLSNGKTRMEELLSLTKKIKFVNDTYWTARSGVDPACQIRRFGDRLLGIHLRDLTFGKKFLDVVPRDTFIGDGVIDFHSVLEATQEAGCEYFVIEQNTEAPYEDIQKSLESLKKIRSVSV